MDNFEQINETKFEWDLKIKKASGSSDFALWQMQARWQFNNSIYNGGEFTNNNFVIKEVGSAMNQEGIFFLDGDCSVVGSAPDQELNWAVSNPPANGEAMTIISDSWVKVARFQVQLTNSSNPHNFSDVDPEFAFQQSGNEVKVIRANNTSSTYDGAGHTSVPMNSASPSLGTQVNNRQLAGYWFTGTGDFDATARWNNVTSQNANTVPGATNNAGISGDITVNGSFEVSQLAVTSGNYMKVTEAGEVTATDLYNDNTEGGGSGSVELAKWDFEDTNQTGETYTADDGISANSGTAEFNTTANFDDYYSDVTTGNTTRSPFANNFYESSIGGSNYYDWNIEFSTEGYENIKISSIQWSDATTFSTTGPTEFKLQWSTDGSTWSDVSGGTITVAEDWTTGVLNGLSLPNNINDESSVYIRWLNTTTETGYSAIDDIVITGEAQPTGIKVQSTSTGTGSLIHNNSGVPATVERYIPAATDWSNASDAWHLLAAPVESQAIDPDFTEAIADYDFFGWDEPNNMWRNFEDGNFTTWNGNDNFVSGRGYLVAYKNSDTKSFVGNMHANDKSVSLSKNSTDTYSGWNLIGNPFPSAIKWDDGNWSLGDVGSVAYVWDEGSADYVARNTDGIIPAMNGMMVYLSSGTSQNLTIPAASKTHSSDS